MSLIPGVLEEGDVSAEIIEEAGVGGAASLEQLLRREAEENKAAEKLEFTVDGRPVSMPEVWAFSKQGVVPDQYR